jgi:type IV pilus assembly protein PilV
MRSQQGLTLIEVLVTVVVLSVGLLGVAAIQSFSLQSNQAAYERTQATSLAYEFADFLRVNRAEVSDSGVNNGWIDFYEAIADDQLPNPEIDITELSRDDLEYRIRVTWSDDRVLDQPDDGDFVEITTRI